MSGLLLPSTQQVSTGAKQVVNFEPEYKGICTYLSPFFPLLNVRPREAVKDAHLMCYKVNVTCNPVVVVDMDWHENFLWQCLTNKESLQPA